MNAQIIGVKKVNKRKVEYFTGVENGESQFSDNPLKGFTSGDATAMKTMAEIMSANDKRNTYETYTISVG
jgi:hypothetical protein